MLEEICRGDLGLITFIGHGDSGKLLLAGADTLRSFELSAIDWSEGQPFVNLVCCSAAATWGQGGGRFEGLPVAALEAHASAVVASFHPLYQGPAIMFARSFYEAALRPSEALTVGEAILKARQSVHEASGGNALLWAMSILWGNPSVRLLRPANGRRTNY